MFLQTNLTENIIPRIGQRIVEYILTTPALLMSISTRSSSFLMTSTNFRIDDITLMSTCLQTTFEFPVSCTILSLAVSALLGFRQARITLPLLSARPTAVWNPIPYQWTEGRKQNVKEIKYFFHAIHTFNVCSFSHLIIVFLKKKNERSSTLCIKRTTAIAFITGWLAVQVVYVKQTRDLHRQWEGFHLIFRHFQKSYIFNQR